MNENDIWNDDTCELEKTKSKMFAITFLVVIGVLILLVIIEFISTKSFFKELQKKTYYVVDINENNKIEIISLLKNIEVEYCESMYKIEYLKLFPDDGSGKIYCNDVDNISFGVYDSTNDNKFAHYIIENVIRERR